MINFIKGLFRPAPSVYTPLWPVLPKGYYLSLAEPMRNPGKNLFLYFEGTLVASKLTRSPKWNMNIEDKDAIAVLHKHLLTIDIWYEAKTKAEKADKIAASLAKKKAVAAGIIAQK